jgi:hypothetical protein
MHAQTHVALHVRCAFACSIMIKIGMRNIKLSQDPVNSYSVVRGYNVELKAQLCTFPSRSSQKIYEDMWSLVPISGTHRCYYMGH